MLRPERQAPLLLRRGHDTLRVSRSQEAVATVIPGASSNAEVTETSGCSAFRFRSNFWRSSRARNSSDGESKHRIEEMEGVDCSTNTGATASFPGSEAHSRNEWRT